MQLSILILLALQKAQSLDADGTLAQPDGAPGTALQDSLGMILLAARDL